MEYNEKFFAERANKKVRNLWLVLEIVFTISYTIEIPNFFVRTFGKKFLIIFHFLYLHVFSAFYLCAAILLKF